MQAYYCFFSIRVILYGIMLRAWLSWMILAKPFRQFAGYTLPSLIKRIYEIAETGDTPYLVRY